MTDGTAVRWMRVGKPSHLSSILAFWKEFKLNTVCWTLFWGFWADTPQQPIGQAAEWAPADQCRSSGNHSRRLFEKTIEGFDCKINGQALGSALRHSLGGSNGQAQTQGVSELAAVAASSLEENVLPLVQYWLSFFMCKMKFQIDFARTTTPSCAGV